MVRLQPLWRAFCLWRRGGTGFVLVHGEAEAVMPARDRRGLLLPGVPGATAHWPARAVRSGNMRIASRLLHEKHFAAAARHGSQQ